MSISFAGDMRLINISTSSPGTLVRRILNSANLTEAFDGVDFSGTLSEVKYVAALHRPRSNNILTEHPAHIGPYVILYFKAYAYWNAMQCLHVLVDWYPDGLSFQRNCVLCRWGGETLK